MNESFIKSSRKCVKSKVDPGLELLKALVQIPARVLLLEQKPVLSHEWSGMVVTHSLYR